MVVGEGSMSKTLVMAASQANTVDLIAGVLCLDFANTVEPRRVPRHGGTPQEYLRNYMDVIAWSQHAATLTGREAEELRIQAEKHPRVAQSTFERIIILREAIYRVYFAIAHKQVPGTVDLDILSTAYGQAMRHAQITRIALGFDLVWKGDSTDLERVLWPIARSAVELLLERDLERVKDCPSGEDGCGWLFYDKSKNNSRRWCSMRGCGGPAKERRRAARRYSNVKQ